MKCILVNFFRLFLKSCDGSRQPNLQPICCSNNELLPARCEYLMFGVIRWHVRAQYANHRSGWGGAIDD